MTQPSGRCLALGSVPFFIQALGLFPCSRGLLGIKSPRRLVTFGMSLPLPISHYKMECSLSLLELIHYRLSGPHSVH